MPRKQFISDVTDHFQISKVDMDHTEFILVRYKYLQINFTKFFVKLISGNNTIIIDSYPEWQIDLLYLETWLMMMLTHISFWNMLVDICIRLRMMNAVQRSKSPLAGLSPKDRRHWPNNAGHPSRMWIYCSTIIIRNSLNIHVVMKKC